MASSTTVIEQPDAEALLRVAERFYSLQGESSRQGLPCLFIRLYGCNLYCAYCDTAYARESAGGEELSVAELLCWADGWPEIMVEVTGGEPLLQAGVYPLLRELTASGRETLLETNGSLPLDRVPDAVRVIMDVKCPDSGMAAHNAPENIAILEERNQRGCRDEIKFVLSSAADFHWARAWLEREYRLVRRLPVFFSPVQPGFDPRRLAALMLEYHPPARLHLQLHKLLWPEESRGV